MDYPKNLNNPFFSFLTLPWNWVKLYCAMQCAIIKYFGLHKNAPYKTHINIAISFHDSPNPSKLFS